MSDRRPRAAAARLRARRRCRERVLDALAQPTIGHLDPAFAELMEETADAAARGRSAPRTARRCRSAAPAAPGWTRWSRTSSSRATASCAACTGCSASGWPTSSSATAPRSCASSAEWGRAIPTEDLVAAATRRASTRCSSSTARRRPASASRSTGSADACRERDALLLVDCVTSLSGQPLALDDAGRRRGVQRDAEVPELPARPRAVHRRRAGDRQARAAATTPVRSWYFDLSLVLVVLDARGRRPRLPPHRADQPGLRAARGAADRRTRRGSRRAGSATPPRTSGCARALGVARLRAARARRRAAAPAARGPPARGRRRRGGAPAPAAPSTASRSAAASATLDGPAVADRRHGRRRRARAAGAARPRARRPSSAPTRPRRCAAPVIDAAAFARLLAGYCLEVRATTSRSSCAPRRSPRRCCSSSSARSSSARRGRCCASSCPARRRASTRTPATSTSTATRRWRSRRRRRRDASLAIQAPENTRALAGDRPRAPAPRGARPPAGAPGRRSRSAGA